MIKAFIFTATSIAGILFSASIAAGNGDITRLANLNTTNKSIDTVDISTADLDAIHQVITEFYRTRNLRGKRVETSAVKRYGETCLAWEVKDLKLVYYSRNGNKDRLPTDYAKVDISVVTRSYEWYNIWKLVKENPIRETITFYKKNGKWSYQKTVLFG